MQSFLHRASSYAPLVLRCGIAAVILWFGVQQLLNPEAWTIWLPEWTAIFGIAPATIVYLNGGFEVVAGLLLLIGFWTRLVAFVLFLHMAVIVLDIGLNPTGVRDSGLAIALLAIALREDEKSVS